MFCIIYVRKEQKERMVTPPSTTAESPVSLPDMVPLQTLNGAQRKLFGFGASSRNEWDKLVLNPAKKKKTGPNTTVTPSPTNKPPSRPPGTVTKQIQTQILLLTTVCTSWTGLIWI